jgi:hypothetical protein
MEIGKIKITQAISGTTIRLNRFLAKALNPILLNSNTVKKPLNKKKRGILKECIQKYR